MTTIAIPFARSEDSLVCSPLSASPYKHFSPPRAVTSSRSPSFSCGTKPAAPPPALPLTPPVYESPIMGPATSSVGPATLAPLRANRPTPVRPPPTPMPDIHTGSIMQNLRDALGEIDLDECEAHGENALFVCDLGEVYRQHQRWQRELGTRVQPFFAVKCNPDPHVLQLLAELGTGFDCASQPEITSVLALPNKVDPDRIIYANPCKAPSFIRHAKNNGVDYMTFDNGDELAKIKKYHPHAKLVLRILTDDSGSLCRLGLKFGAPLGEVRALLQKAKTLDLDVVGVSFHCGSGCTNPALFGDAVRRARWAFDVGKEAGYEFNLLDVGGGFEDENFEIIASVLREAFEEHFPLDKDGNGVRIIAEPGRYFVSRAFELATNIIARRAAREGEGEQEAEAVTAAVEEDEAEKPVVMYYINDGVYGAFNCILFDHQVVQPHVLTLSGTFQGTDDLPAGTTLDACSVWGPTCDSIDCVQATATLPTEALRVGDWLRWENMGAYTVCAASQFNGFRRSEIRYTIDTHGDMETENLIRSLLATPKSA